jgi:peptidoglycan/xylan/chitin deacetylase (PgdA/CDA1 family)
MINRWEQLKLNKELWELFTKREEYVPGHLDKYSRFTHASSCYRNVLEPSVSKFLCENGFKLEYPNGKRFAVCLTHDVDDIYPPLTHIGLSSFCAVKNLDFTRFKQQWTWKFGKKCSSPYLNFKQIIEMEREFEAKSTFYFLTADRDIRGFTYHIEDIQDELKNIIESGWDVGLHIGYYSFNGLGDILSEKRKLEKALGKEVIGCRNHYLRFKVPDTWEILAKAGFGYDTTFGYADSIGFRNGMCHPFRPFNLNSSKEIGIVEIPLTVMDVTVFEYMKQNYITALNSLKKLVDTVEKYNGILTLLWHNNDFSCPFRDNWAELYKEILKYCYLKNAWMTSAEEIYQWYCQSGFVKRQNVIY